MPLSDSQELNSFLNNERKVENGEHSFGNGSQEEQYDSEVKIPLSLIAEKDESPQVA